MPLNFKYYLLTIEDCHKNILLGDNVTNCGTDGPGDWYLVDIHPIF